MTGSIIFSISVADMVSIWRRIYKGLLARLGMKDATVVAILVRATLAVSPFLIQRVTGCRVSNYSSTPTHFLARMFDSIVFCLMNDQQLMVNSFNVFGETLAMV